MYPLGWYLSVKREKKGQLTGGIAFSTRDRALQAVRENTKGDSGELDETCMMTPHGLTPQVELCSSTPSITL